MQAEIETASARANDNPPQPRKTKTKTATATATATDAETDESRRRRKAMDDYDIDIDLNFVQLSRQQLLQRYSSAVRQLRRLAEAHREVRPLSFDSYVLFQYFHQRNWRQRNVGGGGGGGAVSATLVPPPQLMAYLKLEVLHHLLDRRRQILCWLFYLTLVSLCVAAYRYEASGGGSERVVQSTVYPGMRMWRRMTMPLIQRFPRLTELYDESCLMGNPFFQMEDLSCGPCANVESVWFESDECAQLHATVSGSVSGSDRDSDNGLSLLQKCRQTMAEGDSVPFAFKSQQDAMDLSDFYNIYASNHVIFQRDAYRVHSTNQGVHNLEDLFGQFNSSNSGSGSSDMNTKADPPTWTQQAHNLWRCNRMLPARLLRPIFARPSRLPSLGVALERYMAIDTSQAPAYTLPETECPNVYVHQAVGTRFIILRPTSECRHRCRTLSIRLTQSFVLSYNWLYWKPISAPDPISESLSISLIGSYC
ncbi:uncharacterized protein LOC121405440 [Drosophila obscura]|uniref:uncharacterized protein LOC121405440 n=1 Tax=Drosophila obscura TaxID=7282 RepID=UPI001BB255FD|nr:uncharacterized protein LOC121405440 [Drosophila obscura]